MATRKDYYITDDNDYEAARSTYFFAQTFTASSDYALGAVKLKLFKAGTPNTGTITIKAVDGDGKPTGSALSSGTFNANSLGTDTAGDWFEISVTSYNVSNGTKYAIILSDADVSGGNYISWRIDSSGASYAGGTAVSSSDSGSSWAVSSGADFMFETYEVVAYTIDAAKGAFALTGKVVGLTAQRILAAAKGAYTLTGQAITFSRGYCLNVLRGVFNLSFKDFLIKAWIHDTKPTSSYTNDTKPTSSWTNDTKP